MNAETQEWLDSYMAGANDRRELSLPWCGQCARHHWYPKVVCPHCQGAGWTWKPVSGEATLFTWTQVMHSFDTDYEVPFTVVIVQPIEAPEVRIVSNLAEGADAARLTAGMRMHVQFGGEVARRGASMPTFAPSDN
jgi:uncharacterized OB-fold protein